MKNEKEEDSRWLGSPPSPPPLVLYLTYSSIVEQILLLRSSTKTPSASFVSLSLLSPSLFSLPPSFPTLESEEKFAALTLRRLLSASAISFC